MDKMVELSHHLDTHNTDICFIQETWFNDSHSFDKIDGYNILMIDAALSIGGDQETHVSSFEKV